MTEPKINIKGSISNLKVNERKEKPKYSTFLLTISTNQKYQDNDPHLETDAVFFENTVKDILNNLGSYVKLPEGTAWSPDVIKNVDVDYVVEHGKHKKGNALHAHILFRFKHSTKVQLDYNAIKSKILKETGLDNIYMMNKLVKSGMSQNNILDYLDKFRQ